MEIIRDVGTAEPSSGPSARASVAPQRVAARVRREHATIRTMLDDVERACLLAGDGSAVGATRLRGAVWDLYLVFDDHLAMEEAHVAPILRAFDARGEERAVRMILEHNEQRRVILELVEDAERDQIRATELVEEARSLVRAFRTDMEVEESALALVFSGLE